MMGPLTGIRVLEFEAIGPGPFCGMMLADMGADTLLVDRVDDPLLGLGGERRHDLMLRGRRSVTLDLKTADGVAAALLLADRADALIEGHRPGVMERLGLGPDVLLARNPKLVYGRMTGWGQHGPLAQRAGHDIDYVALSGALHGIGRAGGAPVVPLNLVADFGGGGMMLAFGVACALIEAQRSGRGQVVDAAMVDGASLMTTMFWGLSAAKRWNEVRGTNILDSGAPWYDTYATSDGRYLAVGPIEPKFYAEFLRGLGLAREDLPAQHEPAGWPVLRKRFTRSHSLRGRATSGVACSRAPTPASLRCSRSPNPAGMRRASRVAVTWRLGASCSRRQRRVTRARRAPFAVRHRNAEPLVARRSPIGDSRRGNRPAARARSRDQRVTGGGVAAATSQFHRIFRREPRDDASVPASGARVPVARRLSFGFATGERLYRRDERDRNAREPVIGDFLLFRRQQRVQRLAGVGDVLDRREAVPQRFGDELELLRRRALGKAQRVAIAGNVVGELLHPGRIRSPCGALRGGKFQVVGEIQELLARLRAGR